MQGKEVISWNFLFVQAFFKEIILDLARLVFTPFSLKVAWSGKSLIVRVLYIDSPYCCPRCHVCMGW